MLSDYFEPHCVRTHKHCHVKNPFYFLKGKKSPEIMYGVQILGRNNKGVFTVATWGELIFDFLVNKTLISHCAQGKKVHKWYLSTSNAPNKGSIGGLPNQRELINYDFIQMSYYHQSIILSLECWWYIFLKYYYLGASMRGVVGKQPCLLSSSHFFIISII